MKLNFEAALEYIHDNPRVYLREDKSRKGFVCPICGSGTGKSGTGITENPHNKGHFTCWGKNCFTNADVVDIIGIAENIDSKEALKRAFEIYGIEVDNNDTTPVKKREGKPEKETKDYMEYFNECRKELFDNWTEDCYMATRGISKETCAKYFIGIDNHFKTRDHEKDEFTEWKGIVIPTGTTTYVVRNTDKSKSGSERIRNRGEATPFNLKGIRTADRPIFVVEGEIDALSILEVGGMAVGLGGVNSRLQEKFLEELKESRTKQPVVIALDNDESGKNATLELQERLREIGIKQYALNAYGDCKDANAALVENRAKFEKNIKGISYSPVLWQNMQKKTTTNAVTDFMHQIKTSENIPVKSTGFSNLDMILDGGFREDLYILTAATGTGKTNFILQIADNIAQQGHSVFFYNLEMATKELIARSVSRHTVLNVLNGEADGDVRNAKSATDIMTGSKWKKYSPTEVELIMKSVQDYASYCDNIRFFETLGYMDTKDIKSHVEFEVVTTGKPPVVIVDYLQMLSLGVAIKAGKSMTERQCIDAALLDLKQISREYQTTVVIISAINRESSRSSQEIQLESGKESGTIEYSAGVVLSLDFEAKGSDEKFNLDIEMQQNPRKMKVKNLKSRHADSRNYCLFDFYPRYSKFDMRG